MAGGKDLTYRIDVNASDAVASLRGFESAVKRTMKSVESELDDSATAGDKVAKSMDKLASQMKEDFNSATIAAERMQQALKEAGSGLDVSDVIPTLQRMGLSFDEITQDADKLAVSMKQLDDVRMTGVADLDAKAPGLSKKLDDVGKSADSSKSALANMIGNSSQSMGQLVGVTGDLGVGIGQIGEYFADAAFEGEGLGSVFKSMAGVAGPMVALGVATAAIAGHLEDVAATKAFNAERITKFRDALKDSRLEASELKEILSKDDVSGIFVRWRNETENVDQAVSKFFKTFAEFKKVTDEGAEGFDKWSKKQLDAAKAAGAGRIELHNLAEAFKDVKDGSITGTSATQAMADGNEDLVKTALAVASVVHSQGEATRDAGFEAKFYGEAVEDTSKKTESAAAAAEGYAEVLADQTQASRDAAAALLEQIDAMTAAADANIAAVDAQQKFIDATVESAKVQKDGTATTEDKTKATNDERDAAIDSAKAQQRLAGEQAAANGTTLTATQRVDSFNSSLLANASYATPAARNAIYEYLIQVNKIPDTKATEIRAAVAAGDLDTANRLLNETSGARTAAIKADADTAAADRELDAVAAKKREAYIRTYIIPPGVNYDRGGAVGPGGGIAAERRPEFAQFPGGAVALLTAETAVPPGTKVTGGTETARILSGAGGPGNMTVNVNLPRGSRPDDTVKTINRFARRNGGRGRLR